MRIIKNSIKYAFRMRVLTLFAVLSAVFIFCTLLTYQHINKKLTIKQPIKQSKHMPIHSDNIYKKPSVERLLDYSDSRYSRITSYCNPYSSISLNDELVSYSSIISNLSLTKVVVLIRHGDRGPLRMVRNLSTVICDPSNSINKNEFQYKLLTKYYTDIKSKFKLSKISLPYALIPTNSMCNLGHLTRYGVTQHLTLGSHLGEYYGSKLSVKSTNGYGLKAYTTQYARTFQSAVSFLYAFLKPITVFDFKKFPHIVGTFGIFFCNDSKFCPQKCKKIDALNKVLSDKKRRTLESHPAVIKLLEYLIPIIAQNSNQSKLFQSPVSVFDGLMSYMCHNSELPCDENGKCVNLDHVRQLIAYIDFNGKQMSMSHTFKHLSWLKIMSFLSELVLQFSEVQNKSNFILYSAHDLTIVAVSSALDFFDGTLPPYASRIIFESYFHDISNNTYLRIIFNGKDVTRFTEICKLNASECLPFHDTEHKIHLINVKTFQNYLKEKFKAITNSDDYHKACNI